MQLGRDGVGSEDMSLERGVGDGVVIGESMQIELKRPRMGEGESSSMTVATDEEPLARSIGRSKGRGFSSAQIASRKTERFSRAMATLVRSSIKGPNAAQYESSISPISRRRCRILRNFLRSLSPL